MSVSRDRAISIRPVIWKKHDRIFRVMGMSLRPERNHARFRA
jgi:hypothetical protein